MKTQKKLQAIKNLKTYGEAEYLGYKIVETRGPNGYSGKFNITCDGEILNPRGSLSMRDAFARAKKLCPAGDESPAMRTGGDSFEGGK